MSIKTKLPPGVTECRFGDDGLFKCDIDPKTQRETYGRIITRPSNQGSLERLHRPGRKMVFVVRGETIASMHGCTPYEMRLAVGHEPDHIARDVQEQHEHTLVIFQNPHQPAKPATLENILRIAAQCYPELHQLATRGSDIIKGRNHEIASALGGNTHGPHPHHTLPHLPSGGMLFLERRLQMILTRNHTTHPDWQHLDLSHRCKLALLLLEASVRGSLNELFTGNGYTATWETNRWKRSPYEECIYYGDMAIGNLPHAMMLPLDVAVPN